MRMLKIALALTIVLVGCAAPAGVAPRASDGPQPASAPTVKRVVAAFQGDVIGLNGRLRRTGPSIGLEPLEEMVNPGLAMANNKGELRPVLAETVPSLENSLWTVAPDGRMETTWAIKPAARWHDGA